VSTNPGNGVPLIIDISIAGVSRLDSITSITLNSDSSNFYAAGRSVSLTSESIPSSGGYILKINNNLILDQTLVMNSNQILRNNLFVMTQDSGTLEQLVYLNNL